MRSLSLTTAVAIGFVMAIAQLLSSFIGSAATILCGAAVGLISVSLYRRFGDGTESWWRPVAVAIAASSLGVGFGYAAPREERSWTMWLAPLAACGSALLATRAHETALKRCALCKHRIGSGGSFECPRCRLRVCERRCWVFEHLRCRLCEDNRVQLFTPTDAWWDKQFGPPVNYGICQLCGASFEEKELRACGRCGRPQCRMCWDYGNGQCPRCGWLVGGLPPELKDYMVAEQPNNAVAARNAGRS